MTVTVSEGFRDPVRGRRLVRAVRAACTRSWRVMEICGGQTHTLLRSGIDEVLAGAVELVHGPGCPVCVTPLAKIDRALALAARPGLILCTYGDMMRVPGSGEDLLRVRARGGDVRVVYSPLDAVRLAETHPGHQVVFFAVGFETTAPANAMAVKEAWRRGLPNFSVLVSQVRVPPAIRLLMADPEARVDGFLAPGHVCTVMGWREYEALAAELGRPFVVAGFEPVDLLRALHVLVTMLEQGERAVRNEYARAVRREGNGLARELLDEVFETCDMAWRGIGMVPGGGLRLKAVFRDHDAEARFALGAVTAEESAACLAGEVLQGKRKPSACPAFGKACTPETPLGAPMVSSEGACAAYWAFRREEAGHAA